jgi:CheY-like chemotaxis protein
MLKTKEFDLVRMDVQMPEMDGLDATRILRAEERLTGGHMPVVALPAHAMLGDRQRRLDAGMDENIAKPLRPKELFAAMSQSIGDAAAAAKGDGNAAEESRPEAAAAPPGDRPAAPLTAQSAAIDVPTALEGADYDEKLLAELVSLFLEGLPRYLAELEDAYARGDAAAAERTAHTLKGQFRIFGARAAADDALEIERHARRGDLEHGDLLASLVQESQRVRDALVELAAARSGNKS